jgi:RHS repeat-associated protein
VRKIVDGVSTYYFVDDQNLTGYEQVIERFSASGTNSPGSVPEVINVWGHGLIAVISVSGMEFPVVDGHGSVRRIVIADGTLQAGESVYDAYGVETGAGLGSGTLVSRYSGEEVDPSLGMQYLRARWYRLGWGRFATADSFEGRQSDPLSLHRYLYCPDPINARDPSGRFSLTEINIVGAIQVALRTKATKYLILGAGVVVGYATGRYAVQEEVTDSMLIEAVQYVGATIRNNKTRVLQYAKDHKLAYDSVDEVPFLQKVKQSGGGNLLGYAMFTEPWGATKVSTKWLQEHPGAVEIRSLLAHEYGHVLYKHWFIFGPNEDQANDFQGWFGLEFMGIDTRGL